MLFALFTFRYTGRVRDKDDKRKTKFSTQFCQMPELEKFYHSYLRLLSKF